MTHGTDTPGADILALGLMSGTSLDGIDAAVIRTDGERVTGFGPSVTVPYSDRERARLRRWLGHCPGTSEPRETAANRLVTDLHIRAVTTFLEQTGLRPDLVGFHGQTFYHAPERGITWQAGDGARLARETGLPVAWDFRTADVRAGGEGAPLVPVYHRALARDLPKPLAILNIGGVANVTWIGRDPQPPPLAFDTGPGNALMNDFMTARRGLAHDEGGQLARSGRVDSQALAAMMDAPFFRRPPPKSLDRNAFSRAPAEPLSDADGVATLGAFTVESVRRSLDWLPERPLRWLVCGGGRHNRFLMEGLATALGAPVDPVEAVGWDGDALEAQAFAFLAVRCRTGAPQTWPTTTGVPHPLAGGILTLP
ncbi:anhydro-N-acetylmuramic acid kinase [Phaeovibrio sulfidiphilus]